MVYGTLNAGATGTLEMKHTDSPVPQYYILLPILTLGSYEPSDNCCYRWSQLQVWVNPKEPIIRVMVRAGNNIIPRH